MKIDVLPDSDAVAREAAKYIGAEARAAVLARGRFLFGTGYRDPTTRQQSVEGSYERTHRASKLWKPTLEL